MRGRGRSVGVVTDIVHSKSTADVYGEIHELRVLSYRGGLSGRGERGK